MKPSNRLDFAFVILVFLLGMVAIEENARFKKTHPEARDGNGVSDIFDILVTTKSIEYKLADMTNRTRLPP